MKALVVAVATLAACADVPQPFDLDHARIMAVRLDPPAIAAGERARVEVLFTDSTEEPRVADVGACQIAAPGLAVEHDVSAWYVRAPDVVPTTSGIAAVDVTVDTADGSLAAQKTVALGRHAENPVAPAIVLPSLRAGVDAKLAVSPVDAGLSYRWFSSVGDLTGYTRAEVTVAPHERTGHVVVVVRDQDGGTAWTIVNAEVIE